MGVVSEVVLGRACQAVEAMERLRGAGERSLRAQACPLAKRLGRRASAGGAWAQCGGWVVLRGRKCWAEVLMWGYAIAQPCSGRRAQQCTEGARRRRVLAMVDASAIEALARVEVGSVCTPAVSRCVVAEVALGDVGALPGVKPSFAAADSPTGCSSLPWADWRAAPDAVVTQPCRPVGHSSTSRQLFPSTIASRPGRLLIPGAPLLPCPVALSRVAGHVGQG